MKGLVYVSPLSGHGRTLRVTIWTTVFQSIDELTFLTISGLSYFGQPSLPIFLLLRQQSRTDSLKPVHLSIRSLRRKVHCLSIRILVTGVRSRSASINILLKKSVCVSVSSQVAKGVTIVPSNHCQGRQEQEVKKTRISQEERARLP